MLKNTGRKFSGNWSQYTRLTIPVGQFVMYVKKKWKVKFKELLNQLKFKNSLKEIV